MNLILLNAAGAAVPANSPDGVIVHDTKTNLMWSADRIGSERLTLDDAIQAAKECRLGGFDDWRVCELPERLSINDYSRFNPALNTDYFKPCEGFEWTCTPAAWAPREVAWVVNSGNGDSGIYGRYLRRWLRVVRSVSGAAGQ